jgi:hypothetical protein
MVHDELNLKFWDINDNLNPKVRKRLLQIAKDFIEFTKIKNLKILDIIFTGSLTNYSYHSKSDIDLHILINLENFGKHEKFVDEYLQTKKALWNKDHKIEMFGFEVEVYPENKSKNQRPSGLFSLAKNEWITKPIKISEKVDKDLVKKKYQNEVDKILQIEDESKKKNFDYEKVIDDIDKYKASLRDKRNIALREEGEFSPENLVFKMLRNNGFLDKLSSLKKDLYDNSLTLERFKDNMNEYLFSKGDKFILNRESAKMHGRLHDRFKVVSNQTINEGKLSNLVRNLRTRKDYIVETKLLQLFANKNFLTKEMR